MTRFRETVAVITFLPIFAVTAFTVWYLPVYLWPGGHSEWRSF